MSKFKKRIPIIAFAVFLILGASIGTVSAWTKTCSGNIGSSTNCTNTGTGNNATAYFSNQMIDNFKPTSAYKISFSTTTWKPSVTRGAPLYQNYMINDNKNGQVYNFNQHYGKYLNDYSQITQSTGKTTDYYPANYQRPTTVLNIKNADGFDCYSKPLTCVTYSQVSTFNVN